jgi:hypothetical protein
MDYENKERLDAVVRERVIMSCEDNKKIKASLRPERTNRSDCILYVGNTAHLDNLIYEKDAYGTCYLVISRSTSYNGLYTSL